MPYILKPHILGPFHTFTPPSPSISYALLKWLIWSSLVTWQPVYLVLQPPPVTTYFSPHSRHSCLLLLDRFCPFVCLFCGVHCIWTSQIPACSRSIKISMGYQSDWTIFRPSVSEYFVYSCGSDSSGSPVWHSMQFRYQFTSIKYKLADTITMNKSASPTYALY